MTIRDYQNHFLSELSELFPKTEVDTFFSLLIEEYLELKRVDLVMNPNFEIPSEKLAPINEALLRLKQEEPIQYIIGTTEFYGLPFHVNQHVLIPRPETEELVEWIISEVNKNSAILDIGTGSGCIPISLKKHIPSANISSIDVSKEAIEVAKKNAILNEVDINFIEQDILSIDSLDKVIASKTKQSASNIEITLSKTPRNDIKYDIIVSNPPYVRELEKAEMNKNVLDNEPELALFVDDNDPLIFYRKIAELAKAHLNENGLLFFEINEYLGKEMLEMLRLFGFKDVMLKKDIFGKDRMIKASI